MRPTPDPLTAWLGGSRRCRCGAYTLRVLPAAALLAARREAEAMTERDDEVGLCLSACILSRAALRRGRRAFPCGAAVLQRLPAEEIAGLMEAYQALCRDQSPGWGDGEAVSRLQAALADAPGERLKWKILRAFGALPTEPRVRAMTEGDYLYCALQMILDGEEALERLCPDCREAARLPRCPVCGAPAEQENPVFDRARFEELKQNGIS